jgi:hypothetical protein
MYVDECVGASQIYRAMFIGRNVITRTKLYSSLRSELHFGRTHPRAPARARVQKLSAAVDCALVTRRVLHTRQRYDQFENREPAVRSRASCARITACHSAASAITVCVLVRQSAPRRRRTDEHSGQPIIARNCRRAALYPDLLTLSPSSSGSAHFIGGSHPTTTESVMTTYERKDTLRPAAVERNKSVALLSRAVCLPSRGAPSEAVA